MSEIDFTQLALNKETMLSHILFETIDSIEDALNGMQMDIESETEAYFEKLRNMVREYK